MKFAQTCTAADKFYKPEVKHGNLRQLLYTNFTCNKYDNHMLHTFMSRKGYASYVDTI